MSRNQLNLTGKIANGRMDFKNPVYKARIADYLKKNESLDFILSIRAVKDAKSISQLAFYWGVVIPAYVQYTGDTDRERLDTYLRHTFLGRIEEIMGQRVETLPSLKLDSFDLDKPSMSRYISDCINHLNDLGGTIPEDQWNNDWR